MCLSIPPEPTVVHQALPRWVPRPSLSVVTTVAMKEARAGNLSLVNSTSELITALHANEADPAQPVSDEF